MYQAHVAEATKPSRSPHSWPEKPPPEPRATSAAPPNASVAATQNREPKPLDAECPGEEPGQHGQRPEEERDRRRRRELDRVDEGELVQEDPDQRGAGEHQEVAAPDRERALAGTR